MHHVLARLAAAERQAVVVGTEVAAGGIAHHQHIAVEAGAAVAVVQEAVAQPGRQIGAAHQRLAAAAHVEHQAGAGVALEQVALHPRCARVVEVGAVAHVAGEPAVGQEAQAAFGIQAALASVAGGGELVDATQRARHVQAGLGVAAHLQAGPGGQRGADVDVDAFVGVAERLDEVQVHRLGTAGDQQPALRIAQLQVADADEVGVRQVQQGPAALVGHQREQRRQVPFLRRAGHHEAFVDAEPALGATRQSERLQGRVVAGVHLQRGARLQVVGAEQVGEARLGRVGRLAGVAVAAHGGGVFVTGRAAVVHEVVEPVLGHGEGFLAAVMHGQVAEQADLDAQALGAEVDAAVAGDPGVAA